MHPKYPIARSPKRRVAAHGSATRPRPQSRHAKVRLPRWVWLLLVAWSLSTTVLLAVYFGVQVVAALAFVHAALIGLKERISLLLELAVIILKHLL